MRRATAGAILSFVRVIVYSSCAYGPYVRSRVVETVRPPTRWRVASARARRVRARGRQSASSIGPPAADGADVGDVGGAPVGVGRARGRARGGAMREVGARDDDRGGSGSSTTRDVRARGRDRRERREGGGGGGGRVVVSRARRRGRSGEIVARW
tara:strand:+ start:150 stop:614 length:465 start_codon:yes stop_codon:yes gene_type:complete